VLPIDWTRYLQPFQAGREPALLRALAGEGHLAPRSPLRPPQEARPPEPAREASHDRLRARLRRQVRDHAARVLGLDASQPIDGHQPLTDLGLDSLMAVELINALAQSTGCRLPSALMFNRPTLDALTDYLAAGAGAGDEAAPHVSESKTE